MTSTDGPEPASPQGAPEPFSPPPLTQPGHTPPSLQLARKSPNYFVRHWRGELPLYISYWVNGFLASVAAIAALRFLGQSLSQIPSNYVALLVGVLIWTVAGVITVWQLVGIWRSASRPGPDGKTSRWAGLAKLAVVLGVIRTIASFVGEGVPTLKAAVDQARWLNEHAKWNMRLLRGATELEVSGGIGIGFAKDVQAAIDANPSVRIIHLNLGAGGLIDEAKSTRTVIRERRLSTYVSAQCASACTYAYVGGVQRFLKEGAKLGFHAPTAPLATGFEAERMREQERQYLVSVGISPSFSARVVRTPADTMWYPSSDELVEAGVVTQVTSGDSFALSGGSVPSLEQVKSSLDQIRLYRAIKKADPAVFEKAVRAAYDALLLGRSVGELRTTTLPLIMPVYSRSLPNASDEAILAYGRYLVTTLRELQKAPPRACVGYLASDDAVAREEALRYLSKSTKEGELDVMAKVVESAAPGRPRASSRQQEALFGRIVEHASRLVGDDILALQDVGKSTLDPAKGCRAIFGFYSGVMSLPKRDAALMLRALNAQE